MVVSLLFLSVLHYNINMMAELEIYPKKPEKVDKVIEQKPQKRKYKKVNRWMLKRSMLSRVTFTLIFNEQLGDR